MPHYERGTLAGQVEVFLQEQTCLDPALAHNAGVPRLTPIVLVALALLLGLAGCRTSAPEPATVSSPVTATNLAKPVPVPAAPSETPPPPGLEVVKPPVALAPQTIPPTPIPVLAWLPLAAWAADNGLSAPQPQVLNGNPGLRLAVPQGSLELAAGNRTARWNGMSLGLGYAPQGGLGGLLVHPLDAEKNLLPLVNPPAPLPRTNRVIVLDPGHGGDNHGTTSIVDGRLEKNLALDWALRLQPLLEARGWTVHLTRTNDCDLPRSNRVALAEQWQGDLFLSLHFNSALPNREPRGIETYCLTPAGLPSNLVREFADDPARVLPNNAHDAANLHYAMRLQRALVTATGCPDRGVRRARFMEVLHGQNRPSVLLEGGYLSNPQEARLIGTVAYRQKLAEAIASALE